MRKSVGSVGRGQLGKRVLSGAMAAVLAVGMMPALAFAGEGEAPEPAMSLTAGMQAQEDVAATSIAAIGDATYDTLQAAVDAAQPGDTITILADSSDDTGAKIENKTLIIDFAGHTLSGVEGVKAPVFGMKGSDVTFKDSSAAAGGKLGGISLPSKVTADNGREALASSPFDVEGGKLTLESGEYTTQGTVRLIWASGADIFFGKQGADDALLRINMAKSGGSTSAEIVGQSPYVEAINVEVNSGVFSAVQYFSSSLLGTMTVRGGQISTELDAAISYAGTELKIEGGTIESNASSAINITGNNFNLSMSEGTLISDGSNSAISLGSKVSAGSIEITGGKFSSVPLDNVPAGVVVDYGDRTVVYKDGWYTIGSYEGPAITTKASDFGELVKGFAINDVQLTTFPSLENCKFEVVDPLPEGLTLNDAGILSGTPAISGDCTFSVKAIDTSDEGNPNSGAIASYTVTIVEPSVPDFITDASLPEAWTGLNYKVTIEAGACMPSKVTYSIASGELPAGLKFDASSCTISGRPSGTEDSVYRFTVKADNGYAEGSTKEFSINVNVTGGIVGTTPYHTLQDAIDAGASEPGSTIGTVANVVENVIIPADANLIASRMDCTGLPDGGSTVTNNGEVVINNGTIVAGSKNDPAVSNYGTMTINRATLESQSTDNPLVLVSGRDAAKAKLTLINCGLKGGKYQIEVADGGYCTIQDNWIARYSKNSIGNGELNQEGAAVLVRLKKGVELDGQIVVGKNSTIDEGSSLPDGLSFANGIFAGAPTSIGIFDVKLNEQYSRYSGSMIVRFQVADTSDLDAAIEASETAKAASDEANAAAKAAAEAKGAADSEEGVVAKAAAIEAAQEKAEAALEKAQAAKAAADAAIEAADNAAQSAEANYVDSAAIEQVVNTASDLQDAANQALAAAQTETQVLTAVAAAYGAAAQVVTAAETAQKAAESELAVAKDAQKAAEDKAAKAEEAKKAADEKTAAAEKKANEAAASQKVAEDKAKAAEDTASKSLKKNTMTVKAKTVKAKAKKATKVSAKKAFTVKSAKGKVSYYKVNGNAKITVSAKGKVTVKKGLKKGKTYKVKVLVVAKGDKSYAPTFKTAKLKVKITK